MSVIKKLFGSGGASGKLPAPADQLVIIDGPSVFGHPKTPLGPKEQLGILNKVSNINKKEKWHLDIVFEGEPLKKVEHGGRFDDVITVFFAPSAVHFLDFVTDRAKSNKRSKKVTVVTSDKDLTEKLGKISGVNIMQANSFKKAFEGGGRSSGRSSGGRDGGGRRRRGGRGRSKGEGGGGGRGKGKGGNGKPVKPRDAVSDLIDLVD